LIVRICLLLQIKHTEITIIVYFVRANILIRFINTNFVAYVVSKLSAVDRMNAGIRMVLVV